MLRAIERYRAESSLLNFIRLMWPVVEPARPLVEGWPLEAICEHLEAVSRGEITRLLINIFPGATKSLTADVFFPAYEWGPLDRPSLRYMCASYTGDLTRRDNLRFRRLITSTLYQEMWGDRFAPSEEQFNIIRVANNKTGWKLATSVGGVGTGERSDRVTIDDGNNPLEVESEAVMRTTEMWFLEVIPDRLNDLDRSAIINIQQRTSENDISGIILSKELNYEHLCIPMRYESNRHCVTGIGWEDPRGLDEDGNPLGDAERQERDGMLAWTDRFSEKAVRDLEVAKGPYAFTAQYQQRPTPRGGGIFKREWVEPWPPCNPDGTFPQDMVIGNRIQFPALEYIAAWVDTAFTAKSTNDFSAMIVFGVFRGGGHGVITRRTDGTFVRILDDVGFPRIIVLYGWMKRLELHGPPQMEKPPNLDLRDWNGPEWRAVRQREWGLAEWVHDTCVRYKVDHLGIETQAQGHGLEQELVRMNTHKRYGVELVPAKGDKVARAYSVQPMLSSRQVYFPTYEDGTYPTWLTPLADQIFDFRPTSHNDDAVDAFTGGLRHLRDSGIFDRREEYEEAVEDSLNWKKNRRVALPYGLG